MKRKLSIFCLIIAASLSANEPVVEKEKGAFVYIISEEDGKAIEEIISTMGTHNVLSLGLKKGHLKALGKKLKGVGPLQFLGYIFAHQDLASHMNAIRSSSFKWNGFMDGLKPGLDREAQSKELYKQLPGFAKLISADENRLKSHAEKREWDDFVDSLIK